MERRIELHKILCNILGSKNVYFQPPESIKMNYPAIVYSLDDLSGSYANNGVYLLSKQYSLTLIDRDPDNSFVERIALLPFCSFDRHYKMDNLNHYVFTIYF